MESKPTEKFSYTHYPNSEAEIIVTYNDERAIVVGKDAETIQKAAAEIIYEKMEERRIYQAALIKARDALERLGGDTADIEARDEALSTINEVLS
jgi:hypothetical protein